MKGKALTNKLMRVALLCGAPVLFGCASNGALRASLNERDAEIADLSAENYRMSQDLAKVRSDRDGLRAALSQATAELAAQPATPMPAAHQGLSYDDLAAEGIDASRRGDAIVFTVPSAVTFGSGKADLTTSGRKALSLLASRMQGDFPDEAQFFVEGHTDSDPIRKSGYKTNRDLSWARARAVHSFFVEECDIPDDRFVVVGHGPYRGLVTNDSKTNKAKNRRVEVLVRAGN